MRWARTVFLPVAIVSTLGAAGQDSFTRDELDRLKAEQAEAEARLAALEGVQSAAETDVASLNRDLIEAAMESRRQEERATMAETRLVDLTERRRSLRDTLFRETENLDELLGMLALSGRSRPPALVTSPEDASDAIRASIVMAEMAPRLDARTNELSAEIDRLNRLELQLREERQRLRTSEAVLAEKRVEIERLVAAKQALYTDVSAETEALRTRVAALSEQAGDLEDLLTGLEALAPPAPPTKPDRPVQYASLTPLPAPQPVQNASSVPVATAGAATVRPLQPAAGLVVTAFGAEIAPGVISEGIEIETRQSAQIAAPAAGTVEYAGDFRSYRQMLILRTAEGYHVILAGMSEVYPSVGDTIARAEPVGRMPERALPPPELYLEVRKGGRAIDPSAWMKDGE